MNMRLKKGFLLAMAVYFMIVAGLTSIGLYMFAFQVSREAGIYGPKSVRSYYIGVAALRYAYIFLVDPTHRLTNPEKGGTAWTSAWDGDTATLNITSGSNYDEFYRDLELTSSEALSITIDEYDTNASDVDRHEPNILPNNYRITINYNS